MPKSELLVLDPDSKEFEKWLTQPGFRRPLATVLHHTWSPTAAQYKGRQTILNIESFHMAPASDGGRGFSAIAANAYACPDGKVVTGRPLSYDNWAHALVSRSHPEREAAAISHGDRQWFNHCAFGLETVANFDIEDPFGGGRAAESFQAAMHVLVTVHRVFGIPSGHLFFHRDVADKSCPGARLNRSDVRARLALLLGESREIVVVGPDNQPIDCAPLWSGDHITVLAAPLLATLGADPATVASAIHANGRSYVSELDALLPEWSLVYRAMPQGPRVYVKRAVV